MDELELVDLGDTTEETKQCTPMAFLPDSWFQWGEKETTQPPQC
jgi:hypothetical protein